MWLAYIGCDPQSVLRPPPPLGERGHVVGEQHGTQARTDLEVQRARGVAHAVAITSRGSTRPVDAERTSPTRRAPSRR
jgi:hypothetical protein